jgi:hypothetical protein
VVAEIDRRDRSIRYLQRVRRGNTGKLGADDH